MNIFEKSMKDYKENKTLNTKTTVDEDSTVSISIPNKNYGRIINDKTSRRSGRAVSFYLSDEASHILDEYCFKYDKARSNVIDVLIKEILK